MLSSESVIHFISKFASHLVSCGRSAGDFRVSASFRHLHQSPHPSPRGHDWSSAPYWKCKSNQGRTTHPSSRVHRLGDEEYVNDTRHGASDTISLLARQTRTGWREILWERENLLHVDSVSEFDREYTRSGIR